MSVPLLEVVGLSKDYAALRPLRIQTLSVAAGKSITITGLDAGAAELFSHLVTGAALPDEGVVRLFGTDTRAIASTEEWLRSLDSLGLITARAVLVGQLSVLQNVAMPFTLEIDPIDPLLLVQVEALAREVELDQAIWHQALGNMPAGVQMRVRLARALALKPLLVLAEHPSAELPAEDVAPFAADMARVVASRGATLLTLTADERMVKPLGASRLTLKPATGELKKPGWFGF